MTVHDFQIILETQTTLFRRLAEYQVNLREAVYEKDYVRAEQSIGSLKMLSEDIRDCELERQTAFEALLVRMGISGEFGLTMLLASLEGRDREGLAKAFRNLKVAVLQVRTLNEGIMAYSGAQMSTMEGILDEIYPARKAGTYTAMGRRQKTAQPVVVDHRL